MILCCPFCSVDVKPADRECPSCKRPMLRRCPYCAEEIAVNASLCKYCGEEMTPERASSPAARREPAEIVFIEEPAKACAWEDTKKGVLRRWWGTWMASNSNPRRFFQEMPTSGGHRWPVGFAYGLVAQALTLFVLLAAAAVGIAAWNGESVERGPLLLGAGLVVAAIPATFLAVTVGLYLSAALWHVLLKLLGSKAPFESTLRVVGYTTGTQVWGLVPYAGLLIQPIMQTVLCYHGFREVHGLSKGRALFAALVPILFILLLVAAAIALVGISHGCCGHC